MHQNGDRIAALRVLRSSDQVTTLHPEETVFTAMLSGWADQQRSRGLKDSTVMARLAIIRRFRDFTQAYPWQWRVGDVEQFSNDASSHKLTLATLRNQHGTLRVFCDYITNAHYDWAETCQELFGQVPSQICLPWNTIVHRLDYEADPARRPFSYDELQTFFDTADAKVEALVKAGKKGALGALRDAQLVKTIYAFGLRRTEAVMLDLTDMHHNPAVPQFGNYGAVHIRFAKSAAGSAPRRRTVLLIPEFRWWIEGMKQWVEQGRPRFGTHDLDAVWVTERQTRLSAGYLDRRFAEIRAEAGLPQALTLHSLRHSYVTHLIEFGYAERFVQEQAGHLHASSTAIYTSVSSDYKNRILNTAVQKLLGEVSKHEH